MSFIFQGGHFIEPAIPENRRQLFIESVDTVILEITGYCNRVCSYCPVSLVPRVRQKDIMEPAVLDCIVRDLSAINYKENICLNLYNEPLSDKDYLLESVRRLRGALPNARIYFSTNGDYLDREYLDALVEAGLSALTISIHTAPSKKYDILEAMGRITELSAELRCGVKFSRVEQFDVVGKLKYKPIPVTLFSRDFEKNGVDRAGSMKNVLVSHKRTAPCDRPFSTFNVDFRGNIYPCCQFYPDLSVSEGARTGQLLEFPTIFDAYATQALAEWRKQTFLYGEKKSPCDTCLEADIAGTPEQISERLRLGEEFGITTSPLFTKETFSPTATDTPPQNLVGEAFLSKK